MRDAGIICASRVPRWPFPSLVHYVSTSDETRNENGNAALWNRDIFSPSDGRLRAIFVDPCQPWHRLPSWQAGKMQRSSRNALKPSALGAGERVPLRAREAHETPLDTKRASSVVGLDLLAR